MRGVRSAASTFSSGPVWFDEPAATPVSDPVDGEESACPPGENGFGAAERLASSRAWSGSTSATFDLVAGGLVALALSADGGPGLTASVLPSRLMLAGPADIAAAGASAASSCGDSAAVRRSFVVILLRNCSSASAKAGSFAPFAIVTSDGDSPWATVETSVPDTGCLGVEEASGVSTTEHVGELAAAASDDALSDGADGGAGGGGRVASSLTCLVAGAFSSATSSRTSVGTLRFPCQPRVA